MNYFVDVQGAKIVRNYCKKRKLILEMFRVLREIYGENQQ